MFAKLTSTKLTTAKLAWNRVSRQACPGLHPEPMLVVARAHANDNHVARRGVAGGAGRPALTCRWVPSATGGLECRWSLAHGEATRLDEPADADWASRPVALGGRRLALVAGRALRAL